MIRASFRTLLTRFIGFLIATGAAFSLFFLLVISSAYGFFLYAVPVCIYLFALIAIGIATMLDQPWARLSLGILLPLQALGLVIYVILKAPRPGQVCDLSCYAIPLETIALLPVALSLIAAWVVYPGRTKESRGT